MFITFTMYIPEIVGVTNSVKECNTKVYVYNFLPGEIKLTSAVESLSANSPIGVTGVTVTDVVKQNGNSESISISLVTEVAVSVVL